ncbi:MAG: hypothetical protein RLZZ436_266 [Planctomycetota bacterium]
MFLFRTPFAMALLVLFSALAASSSACFAVQAAVPAGPPAAGATPEGIAFFEQKIRPVLVQHCYSCHSQEASAANSLKAGLYLDTAAGIAAGGESGPVVLPGKSAESPLLSAIRYDGLEMPPSGKLPDEVAADFAQWIDMGAPDPRVGDIPRPVRREIDLHVGRQWWSFRPLQQPVPPDLQKPIDSFIRAGWQQQGLTPAAPAAKQTLIRRAWLDLTGLPPAPEKVAAFLADSSPDAFAKVVDELLASPAYGERWARHWLDTARFAESGGYEFDGFRPGAWHYRDWVIRSLNEDLPWDQFLRMQLAGDLLEPDSLNGAAASGFLVAGPYPGQITAKTVERIRYDQLDDMLMTIGGSMLGLTLGCVRCHDHKYDPIPQQDYYSIAASLARTVHGTKTYDYDPAATERREQQHRSEHEAFTAALTSFATDQLPARFAAWRQNQLPSLADNPRWQVLEPTAVDAERSWLKSLPGGLIVHDGQLVPGATVPQRGRRRNVASEERYELRFLTHQKNLQALRLDIFTEKSLPQKGPGLNGDGSFQLAEVQLSARPLNSTDAPVPTELKLAFAAFADDNQPASQALDNKPNTAWVVRTSAKKDNALILEFGQPLAGSENGTELILTLQFRDAGIGRFRASISTEPNPATWAGSVGDQHAGELRAIAAAFPQQPPAAIQLPLARWMTPFDADTAQVFQAEQLHAAAAPRPDFREVYTTVAGGQDVHLLRRGEVDNKLGLAQPGFLQVLWRGSQPAAPVAEPAEPARVALARWITDLEYGAGPLAARVIVNRVWQHHFGEGLVGTPNDFGVQGDPPSHPELLEYLAAELVRGGWQLKPLHRAILLSDTWQLGHTAAPENLAKDPTNRWLWHFRPRRLEAEAIRDSLLAVGGSLDSTLYGPSVLDNTARRSVYLRVKRSELLPIMTVFDAPEPTQSIGERSITTVPTQALTLLNSPIVRQQAEKLAALVRNTPERPLEDAIRDAWQRALARQPEPAELSRMQSFIHQQSTALGAQSPANDQRAFEEFCHVLLCLNEFVYID